MIATMPISAEQLDEFADAVVSLAHRIDPRGREVPGVRRLTPGEILVLHEIATDPGSTATTVARRIGLQRSNVSATLHRLESEELVRRVPAHKFDRGIGFELTPIAHGELDQVRKYRSQRLQTAPAELLTAVVAHADVLSRLAREVSALPTS
ncbi:MarR family winged helix-turn-helix transcriptional regulator [Microbacterium sp. ZW CA_36]|uniref:MarR family winged helix-turn-helix transcriptional regulator n=1 Tax=Microbacterium sp. ZW CA_36 TaxID=3378078 RepID=UPI0038542D62